MDSNKDEGAKCISLAESYIRQGNYERAQKFLEKSERLYPTDKAQELIASLEELKREAPSQSQPHTFTRQTKRERSRNREESPEQETAPTFTSEQHTMIERIRKCKNYYEILRVSKDCTENDLKKSYRKLALHVHPDKNKAPGSAEAFKAVGNAYATLSAPEKRRRYDLYGDESDRPERTTRRRQHAQWGGNGFADGEIDPDELFNMFFGPGVFTYTNRNMHPFRQQGQQHAHQQHQVHTGSYAMWLQLAPILLLVFFSMLSGLFTAEPAYSLQQSQRYPMLRKTQNMGVEYYVKPDFKDTFKGNLVKLERQIQDEYISSLQLTCYRERAAKENLYFKAQYLGSKTMYDRAQTMKTPACDTLRDVYGVA